MAGVGLGLGRIREQFYLHFEIFRSVVEKLMFIKNHFKLMSLKLYLFLTRGKHIIKKIIIFPKSKDLKIRILSIGENILKELYKPYPESNFTVSTKFTLFI